MLIKDVNAELRFTAHLTAGLADRRDQDNIRHSVRDLLGQRIVGPLPAGTTVEAACPQRLATPRTSSTRPVGVSTAM